MNLESKLSFLPLVLLAFAAEAQTETVTPKPKKLQQLYLSVGTGPAAVSHKYSNPLGGAALFNITYAAGPANLFRFNVQHSGFSGWLGKVPGPFDYLEFEGYNSEFSFHNNNTALNLSFGKKRKLSELVQIQGFVGFGVNQISTSEIENREVIEGIRCGNPFMRNYLKPGVLLQAEAMFLPIKFAGLTIDAYTNLVPKFSTAGLNLSLNLGLLK